MVRRMTKVPDTGTKQLDQGGLVSFHSRWLIVRSSLPVLLPCPAPVRAAHRSWRGSAASQILMTMLTKCRKRCSRSERGAHGARFRPPSPPPKAATKAGAGTQRPGGSSGERERRKQRLRLRSVQVGHHTTALAGKKVHHVRLSRPQTPPGWRDAGAGTTCRPRATVCGGLW